MAVSNADRRQVVTRGTANVFADLGFPDAVERQARLRLALALNQLLAGRQLSPIEAAKVLGVTQPEGVALRRYKLADFSVERLMSFANEPGHAVRVRNEDFWQDLDRHLAV